jgi:hypothetical protein
MSIKLSLCILASTTFFNFLRVNFQIAFYNLRSDFTAKFARQIKAVKY